METTEKKIIQLNLSEDEAKLLLAFYLYGMVANSNNIFPILISADPRFREVLSYSDRLLFNYQEKDNSSCIDSLDDKMRVLHKL